MTNPAAFGDLTRLSQQLATASGAGIINVASNLIRQAAEQVAAQAKDNAPKKTGALANSIATVFLGPTTAMIGPTKKYGVFQEYGTASRGEFGGQPYVIEPKRANKLAFQVNGQWVFTKRVVHPGIPPHPFMRPAARDQLDKLQADLGQTGIDLILGGKA